MNKRLNEALRHYKYERRGSTSGGKKRLRDIRVHAEVIGMTEKPNQRIGHSFQKMLEQQADILERQLKASWDAKHSQVPQTIFSSKDVKQQSDY